MMSRLKKTVWEYLVMSVAAFLFAFAWEGLMIPNQMSSGGLMGLCTIVQYATSGVMSASTLYVVLNVVLLIFAFLVMGVGFGFKTIYCIALSSLLMHLLSGVEALHAIPGSFLYIKDPVLVPLLAGLFEGVGLGLIFRYEGSTGGMDIVALFVSKYWPVSTGTFFLMADSVIITSILFLPDRILGDLVYGYLMMLVSSLVLDYITLGARSSVQVMVFSDRFEEIADRIIEMDRGVTVVKAQGWYTKKDKNVLLIMLRKKELFHVTRVIKELDPSAFVSVAPASSVYGEGFEEMKVGISKKKQKNVE